MALDVWTDFLRRLEPYAARIDRTHQIIYLEGGGEIRIQSGYEPERLRGVGLDCVIIDEAAYCAESVWDALRPTLADRKGKALFLSTPRGRNWFWRIYEQGFDPLHPEWESWRMPTAKNPLIDPLEIDTAQHDFSARMFKQEYEAEFLEDYGTIFRGVMECVTPEKPPRSVEEPVCIGLDWGRADDYTVAIVLGMESRRVLAMDCFNQITWSLQRDRIKALAKRWKPQIILAEANSIGSPNIEALIAENVPVRPFTMTAQNKGTLVDALALAIEEKQITLINDPVLIHELQAFEMEILPSGHYRYSAPEGDHDDTVIALALSWHAAGLSRIARIKHYA